VGEGQGSDAPDPGPRDRVVGSRSFPRRPAAPGFAAATAATVAALSPADAAWASGRAAAADARGDSAAECPAVGVASSVDMTSDKMLKTRPLLKWNNTAVWKSSLIIGLIIIIILHFCVVYVA
jgi:hypothetical protein